MFPARALLNPYTVVMPLYVQLHLSWREYWSFFAHYFSTVHFLLFFWCCSAIVISAMIIHKATTTEHIRRHALTLFSYWFTALYALGACLAVSLEWGRIRSSWKVRQTIFFGFCGPLFC